MIGEDVIEEISLLVQNLATMLRLVLGGGEGVGEGGMECLSSNRDVKIK